MRIDAYSQIQQMYNISKPAGAKTTSAVQSNFRDKLQISDAGKDLQVAKQAVSNAPDVREDKVAAIKNAMANGTYNVSGDDFASKILEKFGQTLA